MHKTTSGWIILLNFIIYINFIKKKLIVSGIEREIVQIISDISLTTIRFLFPTLYSTLYPYHGQRHFSTWASE